MFVPSNMFKPSSNFLTDRFKAVLLLWIHFVICVSCLSEVVKLDHYRGLYRGFMDTGYLPFYFQGYRILSILLPGI